MEIITMMLCILSMALIIDSFAISKLTKTLFMMREGDKLACSLYCSILNEMMKVKGVKQKLDKSTDSESVVCKNEIEGYMNKINKIIFTNQRMEKELYRRLKKRQIIKSPEEMYKELDNKGVK